MNRAQRRAAKKNHEGRWHPTKRAFAATYSPDTPEDSRRARIAILEHLAYSPREIAEMLPPLEPATANTETEEHHG